MKRRYSADIFVNGKWHCGSNSTSKKGVIDGLRHYADLLKQEQDAIAHGLKIRNTNRIEIRPSR